MSPPLENDALLLALERDTHPAAILSDGKIAWANRSFRSIFGQATTCEDIGPGVAAWLATPIKEPAEREIAAWHADRSSWLAEIRALPVGEKHTLLFLRDVTARRRSEARLRHLAHHDALTGLPNRELLLDRLGQAMRTRQRAPDTSPREVAVAFLDLDGFKAVNDHLGHAAGDELLRAVARRLQGAVRAADTVARLGGDEFALVLPGVRGSDDARAVGQKLIAALTAPVTLRDREARVSVSIGMALFPSDADSPRALLDRADAAMYAARREGVGRLRLWSGTSTDVEGRGSRLRALMARPEPPPCTWIPDISPRTLRPMGASMLVEWPRDPGEVTSSAHWFDLADREGLAADLADRLLGRLVEAAEGQSAGGWVLGAVPPAAWGERDWGTRLISRLNALGPRRVYLEIGELELARWAEGQSPRIDELRAAGVGLALSPTATGAVLLADLRGTPIDMLRFDASSASAGLSRALTALAHSLGLLVVGVGVEDPQTTRELADAGVDAITGWHLRSDAGKPRD